MAKMNLPKVALGTWSWGAGFAGGDQVFGNQTNSENLKGVYEKAMALGLNLWDTATVYGMGASEDILGGFVGEGKREDVIVSTKFTPQLAEMYAGSLMKMLDASLQRLSSEYIDVYWIHNPMDVERWTPQLVEALKSGKVRSVGVSNHNLSQIKRAEEILAAEGFHISAVQNHFSLLYRESEQAGILDFCRANGITFYAYMVLEQGALSGKYDTLHPLPADSQRGQTYNPQLQRIESLVGVMRTIAERYGAKVAQIPVAWAIAKQTLPLIGATSPQHVEDAFAAANIVLTPEEISLLEAAADQTGAETRGSWEAPMV